MIDNTPDEFQDPRKPLAMKQMDAQDDEVAKQNKAVKQKRDEIRIPMRIVRESIKIALMAAGKNVTNFDKKTLKLVSPRFMSLVPEQDDDDLVSRSYSFNLLSPSLFSLHQDGGELEKVMSLPHILKQLPNKDQEAWMDFIVETAGVTDAVDKAEEKQKEAREREMRGKDGTPLYFTKKNVTDIFGDTEKRKIDTFEALDKSYTPEQVGLNLVLSPLVLSPITLSPAVLGPIILSPWVFIPLVLSPRVLSPLIVNPLIFSPIILSPLVLHPLILVPGVFNPIVLSPLVLSPFILSPQVFTPVILSPMVLNPLILTPMVGSPLILSPFVLSPIIYSPQFLFAVVLSPYALSPLIESKLTASEVIMSPSWLS
ncbi:hypothetical protein ANCCEY_10974 [Ancylostoma ceylanicum]|uniref:Uncharacterized protein n=1 Tax=Ancylostoma ceylanicum TaxID=53326 RepID=A0A0D6LFJ1_9BILA|nr:hypothetical protein ANCCEY_10974 [Ancylostoma ceylanicum]